MESHLAEEKLSESTCLISNLERASPADTANKTRNPMRATASKERCFCMLFVVVVVVVVVLLQVEPDTKEIKEQICYLNEKLAFLVQWSLNSDSTKKTKSDWSVSPTANQNQPFHFQVPLLFNEVDRPPCWNRGPS